MDARRDTVRAQRVTHENLLSREGRVASAVESARLSSQQQHEAIVQALRARDGDAAERLVRVHFQDAMAFMLDQGE
jgi:DNA-binding GntR family transcriptional regulator